MKSGIRSNLVGLVSLKKTGLDLRGLRPEIRTVWEILQSEAWVRKKQEEIELSFLSFQLIAARGEV